MTAGIETLDGTRGQGVQAAVGSSAALQDVNSGDANHSTTVTTSSATSVKSTSLCSTTNCPAGTYQVTAYLDVTTACSTTCTYSVSIIYTDDAASKTIVMPLQGTVETTTYGPTAITSSLALAATTNFAQGVLVSAFDRRSIHQLFDDCDSLRNWWACGGQTLPERVPDSVRRLECDL